MRRYILIGVFLGIGLLVGALSFFARPQRTGDRGLVTPARGLGMRELLPHSRTRTWTAVLLDAGCPLRDAFTPTAQNAAAMPKPEGGAPRHGQAEHEHAEHADALQQQVPDVRSRQVDMRCAITGLTRGFAVYLPDGKLKNFDEGGNTKALQAFQSSPTGQAVLSGQAPGANPQARITGRVQADRIIVDEILLL